MDQNDEKFFEQLVGAKSNADEEYEVELAKASTVSPRTKAAEPRIMTEESDDDGAPAGSLIVDVYQTPEDIVVQSAIAGVRPEDIDITATPDKIVIRGSRINEKEVRDEDYLCQECYWGRFVREVIFPQEVDPEKAVVNFKNGILTVRLPKTSKQKTKKLKIKED